jgi:AcrR family transcriptional regulator
VGRWAPDAKGRLVRAALELYGERGFESTTVAEIAERAGLTERTFFRYFTDKREVLFSGAAELEELLVHEVDAAPESVPALDTVLDAFGVAADEFFEHGRDFARQRWRVVMSSPELQERELIKLARLSSSLAGALGRKGIGEPAASLAAESGTAVFRIAFDGWVRDDGGSKLSERIRSSSNELRRVAGGSATG